MATTTALARVNWLVKTWAVARLTELGRTDLVTTINGLQPITTNARMTTARNWILAREVEVWGQYVPSWDAFWQEAVDDIFNRFLADMPVDTVTAIFADTDLNSRATLKALLRVVEMMRCRNLAGG